MDKRTRLERVIAGEGPDRIPVALWRHWPGDDQRAADLARAVAGYQRQFDWDFVVVQPSHTFSVTGYGLQDIWRGHTSGRRDVSRQVISRSLDWTELRPLDPERGDTGKQLECLRLLNEVFALDKIPYLQVIYSPLAQAERLAGREMLLQHLRTQPDRLRTGLNAMTETMLRFVDVLKRTARVAGIVYVVEHASYEILGDAEYQALGLPYDHKIIDSLPREWWFNMIQVNGQTPMLHLFTDFAVQGLNWSDQDASPPLDRAPLNFRGALCGGLGEQTHLHLGTPAVVRDAARQAINLMSHRRFILTNGGTVPVTAPLSNLQAARDAVGVGIG